ncbi:response regulator transcription factor [Actinacidiphila rubida]|uniref:Regulatory protein, luxR family n=1 Tax=Actinacidiphila rubida TaxID=310780 RepID=A0A1H8SWV4_9ACTN|nr:helix-turn-helix transcriptional regulator [Actinacidiphila rubida]SEO83240.1 regulatory protein, luxR family [Actinacidiphila rubida]
MKATITGRLGPREIQTLRGIARGQTLAEIAHDMRVTKDSVRSYLRDVRTKLGVLTREDAVRVGRHLGYITEGCPTCGRGPNELTAAHDTVDGLAPDVLHHAIRVLARRDPEWWRSQLDRMDRMTHTANQQIALGARP